ncbi:hypothetical protein D3C77_454530 [compost metagenome]
MICINKCDGKLQSHRNRILLLTCTGRVIRSGTCRLRCSIQYLGEWIYWLQAFRLPRSSTNCEGISRPSMRCAESVVLFSDETGSARGRIATPRTLAGGRYPTQSGRSPGAAFGQKQTYELGQEQPCNPACQVARTNAWRLVSSTLLDQLIQLC